MMSNITISKNKLTLYGIGLIVVTVLATVSIMPNGEDKSSADGQAWRRFKKWWKEFGKEGENEPKKGKGDDTPMYGG